MRGRFTKFTYLISTAKSAKGERVKIVKSAGASDVHSSIDEEIKKIDPSITGSSDNDNAISNLKTSIALALSEVNSLGYYINGKSLGGSTIKDSISNASSTLSSSYDKMIGAGYNLFGNDSIYPISRLDKFVNFFSNENITGSLVSLEQFDNDTSLESKFPAISHYAKMGLVKSGSYLRVYTSDKTSWDPVFIGSVVQATPIADVGDKNAWISDFSGISAISDFDQNLSSSIGDVFIDNNGTSYRKTAEGYYIPSEFYEGSSKMLSSVSGLEKDVAQLLTSGWTTSVGKPLFDQGGYLILDSLTGTKLLDLSSKLELTDASALTSNASFYFQGMLRIISDSGNWRLSFIADDKTNSFSVSENSLNKKLSIMTSNLKSEIGNGFGTSLSIKESLVEFVVTKDVFKLYVDGVLSSSSQRGAQSSLGNSSFSIELEETDSGEFGAMLSLRNCCLYTYLH